MNSASQQYLITANIQISIHSYLCVINYPDVVISYTSGPVISSGPQIHPGAGWEASTRSPHLFDPSLNCGLESSLCWFNPWMTRTWSSPSPLRWRTVLARSRILEKRSKKSTDSSALLGCLQIKYILYIINNSWTLRKDKKKQVSGKRNLFFF